MAVINPKTGKEFRWERDNWTAHTRALWDHPTMYGGQVKGSVRAIAHIDWMNRRSIAVFGHGHEVIQSAFNDTISASAGTHDHDLVYDLHIPGIDYWRQQRFYRAHGFECWYRPTCSMWLNHVHGFCMVPFTGDPSKAFVERGFKVGVYIDGGWSTYGRLVTSSQAHDYAAHAFGLKGEHTPGTDQSWFPNDPRIFDLHAYVDRRRRVQAA